MNEERLRTRAVKNERPTSEGWPYKRECEQGRRGCWQDAVDEILRRKRRS